MPPVSPLVGVIMGSRSDWDTMRHAAETLERLGVPHEVEVVSAHRTPDKLFRYAEEAAGRGLEVIIAGAGGAAHLPGMCAAKTWLPVLGVPVPATINLPAQIAAGPAIGKAGATNAALLAAAILALKYPDVRTALKDFREQQTRAVLDHPDPRGS